jgi:hypothetical protein
LFVVTDLIEKYQNFSATSILLTLSVISAAMNNSKQLLVLMIIVGFLWRYYLMFVAVEVEKEGQEYNSSAKATNRSASHNYKSSGQGAEKDMYESKEEYRHATSWFPKLLQHTPPSLVASSTSCAHCIDIVSLTIRNDFFVLFNNSALVSWMERIRNVRSITFIGPANDYNMFRQYMNDHYPQLLHAPSSFNDINSNNNDGIGGSNISGSTTAPSIPIRYVNETHWVTTYKERYKCPYSKACQQLIKLHVFDLHSRLDLSYLGNNVLIADSDTVWSADSTFVDIDGRVQYFEVYEKNDETRKNCTGMDPVLFTEGITMGPSSSKSESPQHETLTPYKACARPKYPNATGARHIVHHMLFQRDVMTLLHDAVTRRWNVTTLWEASTICHKLDYCTGRVSEYELYYAYVSEQYPERVRLETLMDGKNYVGSSSSCDARETKCCEERGVLLKGCHDHRARDHLGFCCPN